MNNRPRRLPDHHIMFIDDIKNLFGHRHDPGISTIFPDRVPFLSIVLSCCN
jgi:hypothetical protein